MGPEGRAASLTWSRVGEVRKKTAGSGRGRRRGRGSSDSEMVSEGKESWRTAGRVTLET